MDNFYIEERLSDGSIRDLHFTTCEDLLHWMAGMMDVPPVVGIELVARTDDGRVVRIVVPSTGCARVRVVIDQPVH